MFYQKISPCKPLKDLVSHYWVATWDSKFSSLNSRYYTVANTLTDITFAFNSKNGNDPIVFSVIQGHTGKSDQQSVPEFNHLLGVSLFSHAVPMLLNCKPTDLLDEFITLKDLLGNEGENLTRGIESSFNLSEQIHLLNQFFYKRLNPNVKMDERIASSIRLIKSTQGFLKITDLADATCLSQKQFERRFKDFTGFNPKVFSRIIRFEGVVKSERTWNTHTQAAHELGYHDQAHFIRDFRLFTGMSPREFWKLGDS